MNAEINAKSSILDVWQGKYAFGVPSRSLKSFCSQNVYWSKHFSTLENPEAYSETNQTSKISMLDENS